MSEISNEAGGQNKRNPSLERLTQEAEITIKKQDNTSRSKIAMISIIAFVSLLSVIIVLGPVYNAIVANDKMIDIPSLLASFGSLFGTILGFVLGYYFKDKG